MLYSSHKVLYDIDLLEFPFKNSKIKFASGNDSLVIHVKPKKSVLLSVNLL